MTNQELVNFLEKFPSEAIVKLKVIGYGEDDVANLELYKDEDGNDDGNLILALSGNTIFGGRL